MKQAYGQYKHSMSTVVTGSAKTGHVGTNYTPSLNETSQ